MENEGSTVVKEEGEICGGPCNLHGRCKEGFHCVAMDSDQSHSQISTGGQNHGHIRVNPSALLPRSAPHPEKESISSTPTSSLPQTESNNIMLNSMVGVPTPTGVCQSKANVELMWSRETHMDNFNQEKEDTERKKKPYRMENFADSNENMFSLFAKIMNKHKEQTKDDKSSRSLLSNDMKDSANQGLVGGLTSIDVENDDVKEAASAALDLMVSNEIIKEDELDIVHPDTSEEEKIVVVKEAYSQVVSGIKYYLVLALKVKGQEEEFDVVILSQPWMDPPYTLLSVTEDGSDDELLL